MKAKFINEFERGKTSKGALDMGGEKIRGNFDQYLEDVKANKTEEQKEMDEASHLYAFLYSPKYTEVDIDGEIYHKKEIEIENLYQIDRHDKGDLNAISMMKMRAMHQEGAKLALVDIPSWMHNQKTAHDSEISPELRKYIVENKRKAFG